MRLGMLCRGLASAAGTDVPEALLSCVEAEGVAVVLGVGVDCEATGEDESLTCSVLEVCKDSAAEPC